VIRQLVSISGKSPACKETVENHALVIARSASSDGAISSLLGLLKPGLLRLARNDSNFHFSKIC
jgi:hypothetical protein